MQAHRVSERKYFFAAEENEGNLHAHCGQVEFSRMHAQPRTGIPQENHSLCGGFEQGKKQKRFTTEAQRNTEKEGAGLS
jgi:hypothetical protein